MSFGRASFTRTRPSCSPHGALLVLSALVLSVTPLSPQPVASAPPEETEPPRPTIDPELMETARDVEGSGDPQQAIVVLEDQPDVSHLDANRDAVVTALQETAAESQGALETQLGQRSNEMGSPRILNRFWIQNMVLVELDPSPSNLQSLGALDGVERLIPNREVEGGEPDPAAAAPETATVDDATWGIDRIGAQQAHDELDADGSGVRVATLDTGVDIGHPDLTDRMVSDDPSDPSYPGGWMELDDQGNPVSSEPHDSAEHGTHVSGTIHGGAASDVQIGVAPDADMMHGLVIPEGTGSFAQVAAGLEWALDPTDADGQPAGETADVINMSLGGCGIAEELVEPTRNIRAAGVVPVFAIGNDDSSCPECGEFGTTSPANTYEALAVGATNSDDDVADFSCGSRMNKDDWAQPPADWPDTFIKPDVTAPGANTLSSVPGGDYARLDGTSMATPHVAGTAALMLQAAPDLDPDDIVERLADTAFFDDRHGSERPNERFGHGRIDAFEATRLAATDSGIAGTVIDADGEPLADAAVTEPDSGRTETTGDDGTYRMLLETGTYELTAERFGYEPESIGDIQVPEDGYVTQDIEMTAEPSGAISGTVTMADGGHEVPGVPLALGDTPLATTTDEDGSYVLDGVPVGTYELQVTPTGFPQPEPVPVTVAAGETETVDVELAQPPPPVGILGDHEGALADWLADEGIAARDVDWDDDLDDFARLVVNYPTDPGEDGFADFLETTDAAGTGVVFLESYSPELRGGIGLLSDHTGSPSEVGSGFHGVIPNQYYEVLEGHPALGDWQPGDHIAFDETSLHKVHSWFEGYEGEGRETIALAAPLWDGQPRPGIGVQDRGDNRHVLLSMHGAGQDMVPEWWAPEGGELLLDALEWATVDADD